MCTHMLTYIDTYQAGLMHSQTGNRVTKFFSLLSAARMCLLGACLCFVSLSACLILYIQPAFGISS